MEYNIRNIEQEIKNSFEFSKAILVIGARQVGKTTLLGVIILLTF